MVAPQEVEPDPLGFPPRARPAFLLSPTRGARGGMRAIAGDDQDRTAGRPGTGILDPTADLVGRWHDALHPGGLADRVSVPWMKCADACTPVSRWNCSSLRPNGISAPSRVDRS